MIGDQSSSAEEMTRLYFSQLMGSLVQRGAGLREDVMLRFMHPKWAISGENGHFSVSTNDYACGLKIKEFLESSPGHVR